MRFNKIFLCPKRKALRPPTKIIPKALKSPVHTLDFLLFIAQGNCTCLLAAIQKCHFKTSIIFV